MAEQWEDDAVSDTNGPDRAQDPTGAAGAGEPRHDGSAIPGYQPPPAPSPGTPGQGFPPATGPGPGHPPAPGSSPAPGPVAPPTGGPPPYPPGYAAPGYAPPGYPQPGAVPGYPVQPPPSTGVLPWALGLIALFPIPFVGSLAAGIAMIVAARTPRQQAPTARENANRAANWGLTYLIATVLLVGGHFSVLFVAHEIHGFFPFGLIILSWLAVSVVHVVFSIVGWVQASQGRRVAVTGLPVFR